MRVLLISLGLLFAFMKIMQNLLKNIVFHYDEDGKHPAYHVYTILSLLNNIVSNAVEAIPVEGEVSLSISQKENHVIFQISDNGPGIKERNHHVILNRASL